MLAAFPIYESSGIRGNYAQRTLGKKVYIVIFTFKAVNHVYI